jgi:Flp pilus assembly protein TadD
MSLINEVLRKLDQRPDSSGAGSGPPSLRAAPGTGHHLGRLAGVALVLFLAGAGAGVAGWWAWHQPEPEADPQPVAGQAAGASSGEREASAQAGSGDPPDQDQPAEAARPLALELPPMKGEDRIKAVAPEAPPPAPGKAKPAGSGVTVKRPDAGRLKIELVPPEEQFLADAGSGEPGPVTDAGEAGSGEPGAGRMQVEVPESWKRQRRAAELARAGYVALGKQRYREAVAKLSRSRELGPGRTDVINNLALAQWQAGDRRAAVATLMEGLRANPGDTRMARNLAHFLLRSEGGADRGAGAELLREGLAQYDQLALYALVGSLYRDMDRPQEAIGVYRSGLARKGPHWRLLVGLGLALEAHGQPDAARRVYERAREELPRGQTGVRSSIEARLESLPADGGN